MRVYLKDCKMVEKPNNATTETRVVYGNPYNRIHRDDAGLFVMKRGKECLIQVLSDNGKVLK